MPLFRPGIAVQGITVDAQFVEVGDGSYKTLSIRVSRSKQLALMQEFKFRISASPESGSLGIPASPTSVADKDAKAGKRLW